MNGHRVRVSERAYNQAEELAEEYDTTLSNIASRAVDEQYLARGEFQESIAFLSEIIRGNCNEW